ncbi:MAG: YafY family transcriptional regulator [Oscillospiraceae bacterium]|nr:YafY family transcriptional regulator [Oscillospiraceae bacterium]
MKINRLIEITTILLNRGTVTATELAERFGVSTRTIYRDIDVLSCAGVPVFATQGARGGISIMDGYTLNRTVISKSDSDSIIFALSAMKAANYPEIDAVLEKLGGIFKSNSSVSDWISIDFSPWGSDPNQSNKFDIIKNAIMKSEVIETDYINAQNKKSRRKIAPLRLLFKSSAWYLWGFCYERRDYRTFRISRIKQVCMTGVTFERNGLEPVPRDEKNVECCVCSRFVMRFTEDALFRLYDDYDDYMFCKNNDGSYTLEAELPEEEWVYNYILSFADCVEVIEPVHVREIIKEKCLKMSKAYKKIAEGY